MLPVLITFSPEVPLTFPLAFSVQFRFVFMSLLFSPAPHAFALTFLREREREMTKKRRWKICRPQNDDDDDDDDDVVDDVYFGCKRKNKLHIFSHE